MTITVQAGITIAKLQEILAKENQQLPVDVSLPDQATLGGAIAVNASGPRRYGYGTLRDYVIGISFINDEGQEVKAGGRVVKNVAGYDLMKLHVGALGTLGIITQVTLKLRPRPEATRLLILGCEPDNLVELADLVNALTRSATRPVCFELLDQSTAYVISRLFDNEEWKCGPPCIGLARYCDWALVLRFEGNSKAVDWQVDRLAREVELGVLACDPTEADGIWRSLVDFPLLPEVIVTFRANLLPSAVPQFCQLPRGWRGGPFLKAHAGSGIVIGHFDGEGDPTREQMEIMLTDLLYRATEAQGNLVIQRCPTEWRRQLPIWGKPRGDYALMGRVKQALDPRGIFNPGRFVDGI
jgi:glycolate oxidase FAD binding subunit